MTVVTEDGVTRIADMNDRHLESLARGGLTAKACELRLMVLEVLRRSGAGHVATSLSCADIVAALYYGGVLRFDPGNPAWENRDRFLMSKGHAATILYCTLADLGFFPVEDLWWTGKEDGKMGVHLQATVPGVEATSGSLGNGPGLGCGIALAARRRGLDYLTYVLLGDGELSEGSVWEAFLFASRRMLGNLVFIVDRNHMCCSDYTENCLSLEPLAAKLSAFGLEVRSVNGHDPAELAEELARPRRSPGDRPLCFIAETVKCKGIPSQENAPMCHFYGPKGEELERAFAEVRGGA